MSVSTVLARRKGILLIAHRKGSRVQPKKVALVVGGTKGIGLAIAKRLLSNYDVVVAGRSVSDSLENSVPRTISMDVSDANSVERGLRLVDQTFGRLDTLICSAGIAQLGTIENTTPSDFEKILLTNLAGPFYLLHHAADLLRASRGNVVIIGSRAARGNFPNVAAYGASKAGLLNLAQTAARDFKVSDVCVHVISPSGVKTNMRSRLFPEEDPELLLLPEQIAALCARVLQTDFRVATGTIIDVPW